MQRVMSFRITFICLLILSLFFRTSIGDVACEFSDELKSSAIAASFEEYIREMKPLRETRFLLEEKELLKTLQKLKLDPKISLTTPDEVKSRDDYTFSVQIIGCSEERNIRKISVLHFYSGRAAYEYLVVFKKEYSGWKLDSVKLAAIS